MQQVLQVANGNAAEICVKKKQGPRAQSMFLMWSIVFAELFALQ